MSILCLNKLSEMQIKDIQCLVDICNKHDGTKNELYLSNEFNAYPEMKSFFLYQRSEELLGILTVSASLKESAVISAYVLPGARQQGVFSRLLSTALEELKRFGYGKVNYKTEKAFKQVEVIKEKYNAKKAGSEFLMYHNILFKAVIKQQMDGLVVRQAKQEDRLRLVQIDARAFQNSMELAELNVEQSFANPSVYYYTLLHMGNVLGSCCIDINGKCNLIYSLCIDPEHHGKGLGTFLLNETVCQAYELNSKTISLVVEEGNVHALKMYQSCGFEIVTEFNFYSAAL